MTDEHAPPGAAAVAPPNSNDLRLNLSSWAIKHQSLVIFIIALATLFGIRSYGHLAQSEDPPFTFKVMVVRTLWPGATARQVQEEITDRIARKMQESPALDYLRSYSRPGESTVFFTMKDALGPEEVPSTWYQIRKKIGDIAHTLPVGSQGPFFNDEFGDVYTNLYAFSGDGFSPAQLHDYAERLRVELLRVPDVNKVDFIADQDQLITLEIGNAQLAKLNLRPQQIADAINSQNAVADAGIFTTADDRVFVRPSGQMHDEARLADILLRINGGSIRLGDIATITRAYKDPPEQYMRFAGNTVLGIGVTMAPTGDVVTLGRRLDDTTARLRASLPAGLKLDLVASMPHAVKHSVDDFVEAVAEAIGIVLVVSLISLGFRTGMVVVISIPLVLAGTALLMDFFHIGLHKVSLGTLILALGLLVDDAIIAVETMAVKLEQGFDRLHAAAFAYTSTAFPMLTGTLVTISGFLPIALAKSATGEYTRSIFEVSAIALLLSWLAAVTVIPLLGYHILSEHPTRSAASHTPEAPHQAFDVYDTPFYRRLRTAIAWCVDRRGSILVATVILFAMSLAGFALVPQQFFPSSDRPEVMVDLRLPESASFAASLREAQRLEAALEGNRDVDHFVDFVGAGAPRYYLNLDQQLTTPNFSQFIVTAKDVKARERLMTQLNELMRRDFPQLRTRVSRLENGPPIGYPVQFRVTGPEIATVRGIAERVADMMRKDAGTRNVQFDWDEPAERSVRFEVDQNKARELNVSSLDIANYLQMSLSGYTVTQFRERDKLIGVDLRAPPQDRVDPSQIERLALPSPGGAAIPLSALGRFRYVLEYGVVWERDRLPTITVQSDVHGSEQAIDVTQRIDKNLSAVRGALPLGYRVEIGGAVEENAKAQASINVQMPVLLVVVLVLLMIQLQSFSRVLIVVLTAPLGLIGVIFALLLFHMPFGFVAMLGTIAMFGIIMRNSVILMDQIEQDIRAGHPRFVAIIDATVRRFRPITLTAAAAVLALIPLLRSTFFGPMATALMGGITVATVLTVFYLPALYALWFKSSARRARARRGVMSAVQSLPSSLSVALRPSVAATSLLLLAGCGLFGPERRPPDMPQPLHYPAASAADAAAPGDHLPTADGISQRLQTGAAPTAEWWTAFGSAELDSWVAEGLAHSPSLSSAQNSLRAAREQLRAQIGNSVLPTVDATFAPTRQRALGIPILPDQQTFLENIFVAQVQASYTFDFFGASILADRALARQVDAQALQLQATRRTLAANIVAGAINAASLHEQVLATEQLVRLGEQRAAQTAARTAHGSASQDDLLAATQDAANTAAALPALRAQELGVRHALAVLLGRTPDQAPMSMALSALRVPDDIPLAVPTELLHQRPDVLAAEATLRSAADQAGAATASMFPTMTLSASYGHGGFDWSTFTSPAGVVWSVGASVTQPIFHGGALNARRRQYLAQYDAAVDSYKLTVLSAFRTVADALASLSEDANAVRETERAASAAEHLHHDTDARYRLGAVPFYATLTAEQQYQAAVAQLARSRAARLSDSATLLDAMGTPRSVRSTARR